MEKYTEQEFMALSDEAAMKVSQEAVIELYQSKQEAGSGVQLSDATRAELAALNVKIQEPKVAPAVAERNQYARNVLDWTDKRARVHTISKGDGTNKGSFEYQGITTPDAAYALVTKKITTNDKAIPASDVNNPDETVNRVRFNGFENGKISMAVKGPKGTWQGVNGVTIGSVVDAAKEIYHFGKIRKAGERETIVAS